MWRALLTFVLIGARLRPEDLPIEGTVVVPAAQADTLRLGDEKVKRMVVNMLPAAIRAVSDLVGGDKMAGMAEFVAETYDRLVTAVVLKKAHGDACGAHGVYVNVAEPVDLVTAADHARALAERDRALADNARKDCIIAEKDRIIVLLKEGSQRRCGDRCHADRGGDG